MIPFPSDSLPQCIRVITHPTNQQTSEPTSQVSMNHVVIVISDSVFNRLRHTVINVRLVGLTNVYQVLLHIDSASIQPHTRQPVSYSLFS